MKFAAGKSCKTLVVVNFAMNTSNPLLAHQVAVVEELANFYEKVFVVTGVCQDYLNSERISVVSTDWQSGKNFRNLWKLYKTFFRLLPRTLNSTYFFHMSDLQAAFLSPVLKILNVKCFLWYAHKHYSKYLWWSNFWVTGIITSTPGSCPISSDKVFPIGQGVNVAPLKAHMGSSLDLGLHIGRLDESKNYETIIDSFTSISSNSKSMKLVLYGDPTRPESFEYCDFLKKKYSYEIESGLVNFAGGIKKSLVPLTLSDGDFFIHAYTGSLDKSLIEATFSRLPVITLNQEYISEFGRWSKSSMPLTLENEFRALSELSLTERQDILSKRLALATSHHSFASWVSKLVEILNCSAISSRIRHNS